MIERPRILRNRTVSDSKFVDFTGGATFGGYTPDRTRWIRSHLTAQIIESDNRMQATLNLTSAEGPGLDLHTIVQAIGLAFSMKIDKSWS